MTARIVEALRPNPEKRQDVPDPALSGLYLVIQQSSSKSWALRYRYAGKLKKLTLGRWPVLWVAAARAAVTEAIGTIESGDDPSTEKRAVKNTRNELADRDATRALFDLYSRQRLSKLKAGETARLVLVKHVLSLWSERKVHDLTRRDVIDLLDGI